MSTAKTMSHTCWHNMLPVPCNCSQAGKPATSTIESCLDAPYKQHSHLKNTRVQHTPLVLPALQSATANLAFPMFNLKPNLVQRYHVWRYHLTFTSSGMWAAPWGMSLLATTRIGWEQADPSRSFPVWLYTPTTRRIFFIPHDSLPHLLHSTCACEELC